MKKRLFVLATCVALSNFTYAQPISLGEAINNLPIVQENAQQIAIDNMDVQNASSASAGAKAYANILKDYGIEQSDKGKIQLEINKETLVDKARLSNELKRKQYQLSENIAILGFRKLYAGVMAAEGERDVQRLLYGQVKKDYLLASEQFTNGDITAQELKAKKIALRKADNEVKIAENKYRQYSEKLNIMAGAEILVQPEAPRLNPLQELDYYKAGAENRLAVQAALIQNQITEMDLKFYNDKYALKLREIELIYDKLKRDIKLNKLSAEAGKLAAEKQIEQSYAALLATMTQVESLQANLQDLAERVKQMQALYQAGRISEKQLLNTEIQLKKLENAYHLSAFDLNSKRQALNMDTSVGSSYNQVGNE